MLALLRSADDALLVDVDRLARATPWLHGPMLAYATYAVVLFGALLLVGVVVARGRGPRALAAALWAGPAALLAVAVNQPVGRAVHEARPSTSHPGLLVLAAPTHDFSFPSDHAVMAGAVTAGLFLVSRRVGLVAGAAALLLAFARVYVVAHYPWDVVAGLALGALVALLGWVAVAPRLTVAVRRTCRHPLLRGVLHGPCVPAEAEARS